jgi:hypothetical protein
VNERLYRVRYHAGSLTATRRRDIERAYLEAMRSRLTANPAMPERLKAALHCGIADMEQHHGRVRESRRHFLLALRHGPAQVFAAVSPGRIAKLALVACGAQGLVSLLQRARERRRGEVRG